MIEDVLLLFVIKLQARSDTPSASKFCLRLSIPQVPVISALRVDSTLIHNLSVDLWKLVEVVGFLQAFSEIPETMVDLVIVGLLWVVDTDHDLLSEEPFLRIQKGKKHTDLWIQDIWKVFLPWLKGSIFRDLYWGNWCDTLKGKRFISGVPLIWHNFQNICEFSFELLESLFFVDSLSVSTFIYSVKYLAVVAIFHFERYCQS